MSTSTRSFFFTEYLLTSYITSHDFRSGPGEHARLAQLTVILQDSAVRFFIFVENKLFDVRYFFDIIRQNPRHRSVRFRKGENLEDSSMR